MYLEHFNIIEQPFTLTPNTEFYCNLNTHENALNTLFYGLRSGEGFIKVTGEVGSGKTLLCRKLLNGLEKPFVTAYVPNPDLTPITLKKSLIKELGENISPDADITAINDIITETLLKLHKDHQKVVLIIDEAQALPDETLEAVRLLTNLETESDKLLQIVLFGQPELDVRLNEYKFRQLKQRITFSYQLTSLTKEDTSAYVFHRLSIAGFRKGTLFSRPALDLLYKKSRGTPRLINILCHKAMLSAYGRGQYTIDKNAMKAAIRDTETTSSLEKTSTKTWFISGFAITGVILFIYCYQHFLGSL